MSKEGSSRKQLRGQKNLAVYNDQPRDPKVAAVVDRWSLFRGHLCCKSSIWDLRKVVVVDKGLLFGGGRYGRLSSGLTAFHLLMYVYGYQRNCF